MVSDQEIATCLHSLLRQAGPNVAAAASLPAIVRQLESQLGLDLSHKSAFIADQINLLVAPKDRFLLPQFHHHNQRQLFHHNIAVPPPASSPFTHLPHHHELSFGFAAAAAAHGTVGVAAGGSQYQLGHQQQQGSVAVMPAAVVPAHKESAPKRRGGPGGLSKVCGVTPELQAIVGEPTMARTQIVKQLWAYIRKNNLQDPSNKRKIICNDELRRVFETDCTDMFRMNKLLAKHIRPLDATKDSGSDVKKLKATVTEEVLTPEPKPDQYPVMISDALATFFGTSEKEMLQAEASQRVWDYIKCNQLEDPMNTMAILCDSKLQELFGCESLSALGVSQLLSRHMFKKS